jgi:RNA polymerase sigma-70 factor (ECF subfamily)
MNDGQIEEMTANLPRLRRFAYSLTGTPHDADDLMQGTVERILSRDVPSDVNMVKWMYRVCRNLWIDEVRSRKVRHLAVERGDVTPPASVEGQRVVMDRLTLVDVNHAMDQLPDTQRAVLSLVAVEGLSYAETAETLEIPVGTVMSRVARARKALSESFSDGQDNAPDLTLKNKEG